MRRRLALIALLALVPVGPAADKVSDQPTAEPAQATVQSDTSERISVDFPNEEIVTILRNVADMYELNLVVPRDLYGKRTSLKLRNVTWRQIFREALPPAGYTFIEDDNIVRIVSMDSLRERQTARNGARPSPAAPHSCAPPRWLGWLAVPFALIHLILAIGVLRDRLPGAARYAPKFVWACAVLLGGLAPLLAYWVIHHSTLAKSDGGGTPPKLA